MELKKIDKETAIKLILDKKKQGIDEKSILQFFTDNFIFTEKTYYNWKKEAMQRFNEFTLKAKPIIEAKEIEALGKIAVSKILSKIERQIILSKIARGKIPMTKYIVADGVIHDMPISPSWNDRKNAIAELNKMDGAYIEADNDNEFKGFEIDEI